jgi:phosphoglycolate phosphatase
VTASLPRCLLFDLDGTLLDSLPGIEYSVQQALKTCHLPRPGVSLRTLIGPPIRTILSTLTGISERQVLDELESSFLRTYDQHGWRMTTLYPGARSLLESLSSRNYRLFIASNKRRSISLEILKAHQLDEFFEEIATRDSRTPPYASKAEMIRSLIERRALAPAECLFTGDTMEDAEAAAANGIRFAYMTHGYGDIPDDTHVPVAFRFDNFGNFLPLISGASE